MDEAPDDARPSVPDSDESPVSIEELQQRVIAETDIYIDQRVEEAFRELQETMSAGLEEEMEDTIAEEEEMEEEKQAQPDVLKDVADAVDDEASSRRGTFGINKGGMTWGFFSRIIRAVARMVWTTLITIALLIIYVVTGFFRGALWLVALRWFLVLGILGWAGTAAFTANYTVISDAVRPIFQVIDDIGLRLFAPFINDWLELTFDKGCNFWNFMVELFYSLIRLLVDAFEAIIISQTSATQEWFDDNIWGVAPADFYDGNRRASSPMIPSDPDGYLRTINALFKRQLEYENALEQNVTYVRDTMHRSFGSPSYISALRGEMKHLKRGVFTATSSDGHTYAIPTPVFPRDFALRDVSEGMNPSKPSGKESGKRSYSTFKNLRYEPQFLTESLLGFQFGWDPEADFPRVNISDTSVVFIDGGVEFYVLVITMIDDITNMISAGIEWFLTVIKMYTIEFILQFFLDLICGDDQDCDITKSINEGHVHVRDELDDILDDLRDGDFTAFADLFEYLFLDDGVLTGWFEDAYEFIYTEVIRRFFELIINVLFQIPCLNFDSIGCFLASVLDCILVLDLEVCLECHDACIPGCADDLTCPETCLPYAKSCCDDNDPLVIACVESECRDSELGGLISIFECFGRIALSVVAMFSCPLFEFVSILIDLMITVLNFIEGAIERVFDVIEDDIMGFVNDDLRDFCAFIISPSVTIDLPYPPGDQTLSFDFDIPGGSDDQLCDLFATFNLPLGPFEAAIEDVVGAINDVALLVDDFNNELEEFCDEYNVIAENICLSMGLPEEFCEALSREEPSPDDSMLKQILRKKQQWKDERRLGVSRTSQHFDPYEEIKWMSKNYEDDGQDLHEGVGFSVDADQEKWERRAKEYRESTEHPIARWYYRMTTESYRTNKPTKQDLKDYILDEIRREKIAHLLYLSNNPSMWFSTTKEKNEVHDQRLSSHRRMARKIFDKLFVIDPKSTKASVGLFQSKYKWDDTAEYAKSLRYIQGNATAILMQSMAMFGRVEWMRDEADFKYPERHEILHHLREMGTDEYFSGMFRSTIQYVRTFNEPNLINLDRMVHIEAQRHTTLEKHDDTKDTNDDTKEEAHETPHSLDSGIPPRASPNPYEGAPSVRDRHLRLNAEEKRAYRRLSEEYRWYRDAPSVHIGAHLKTMTMVSFTSLMAPHLVDPVVNSLAARGPAFDAPLTKYLRHFGLTRHLHNITNEVRQWRVRKLHQEELEDGELETIVTMGHAKAQATQDIKYPYDRLYKNDDYRADYEQGKKLVAGEKVDLDRVVMSRHPDGTPKRVRSNALAREMTPAKIDHIHRALPWTMELSHPQLMPMTRTDTLTRHITVQERFLDKRAIVSFATIGTGVKSLLLPLVKIVLENPQMALGVLYPAAISPLGQASLGLWGRWGIRRFNEIFTDYLDLSPSGIEEVALDFAETLVYNIIYALNFLEWLGMGVMMFLGSALLFYAVLAIIALILLTYCLPFSVCIFFVLFYLSALIVNILPLLQGAAFLTLSVPPPPNVDENGIPTQSPILGYTHDLIFCNSTAPSCTTSNDCAGGAFCDCPESTLYHHRAFLFTLGESSPCAVAGSGTCLCWPQLKCGARVPIIRLAEIITPNCEENFGYDFRGQIWYASDGTSFDKFWTVARASMTNFWVETRFIIRGLLVGWLAFIDRFTAALIGISGSLFLLALVKRPMYFFAFTTVIVWLWYFPSAPGDFYVDFILPYFEDVANSDFFLIDWLRIDELFKEIIDFLRFPNYSDNSPLGSPDLGGGEVSCFIIGLFSGFPGLITLLVMGIGLLMTFATGAFWLLLTWFIQLAWMFLNIIWAFIWVGLEKLRRTRHYQSMRNYITGTSTNPRLRGMANRMRGMSDSLQTYARKTASRLDNAGTAASLASIPRASMNYWLPLPPPNKAQLHATIKREREETRRTLEEMNEEMQQMRREIHGMRRRKRSPPTSDARPSRKTAHYDEGSSTDSLIPHVTLYPPTASPETTSTRSALPRDVESHGESFGSMMSEGESAGTFTKAARGFRELWHTLRPDADSSTDKKLE